MEQIAASLVFAHFVRHVLRSHKLRDHLERELNLVMIHNLSEVVQSVQHSIVDIPGLNHGVEAKPKFH